MARLQFLSLEVGCGQSTANDMPWRKAICDAGWLLSMKTEELVHNNTGPGGTEGLLGLCVAPVFFLFCENIRLPHPAFLFVCLKRSMFKYLANQTTLKCLGNSVT